MRSMTGCAHIVRKDKDRRWEVSISTLNSRFLDINVYLPVFNAVLEDKIRTIISDKIFRGKVTVKI